MIPKKAKNKPQPQADHWKEKAFVTLFTDAIEHTYLADAVKEHPGSCARLARSGITSAALSLESAANICLASLPMSKSFAEDIERKFGTLEKFELFVTILKGPGVFDRGCSAVQKVQDIITLRNDFVHPKLLRMPIQFAKDGSRQATVESGTYSHLKVNKSYRAWNGDVALIVLRAVFEFFDTLFREWCQWSPEHTASTLSAAMVKDGSEMVSGIPGEIELIGKAHTHWKVPVSWIRFNVVAPVQEFKTAAPVEASPPPPPPPAQSGSGG